MNGKKYPLDLYNALHSNSYTDLEELEVITMEDANGCKFYAEIFRLPKPEK